VSISTAEFGPAFLDRGHDRRVHVVPHEKGRTGTLTKPLVQFVPFFNRQSEPWSEAIEGRTR